MDSAARCGIQFSPTALSAYKSYSSFSKIYYYYYLISLDYSEGYETENGLPPQSYDDTLYYGPPAEAVFTDPNTGQVYYGKFNFEFFLEICKERESNT